MLVLLTKRDDKGSAVSVVGDKYSNDKNLSILELTGDEMGSPPNLWKEHLLLGHQCTSAGNE